MSLRSVIHAVPRHLAARLLPALLLALPPAVHGQVGAELDAFWAESERTVREGDFDAYAALYHPDAVLVTAGTQSSVPIAEALAGWRQLFVDTAEGRMRADLEIRIAQRFASATTSHETGIFRYVSHPAGGEPDIGLVHFEALLVKGDTGWTWVMEYQKGPATRAEWEALGG